MSRAEKQDYMQNYHWALLALELGLWIKDKKNRKALADAVNGALMAYELDRKQILQSVRHLLHEGSPPSLPTQDSRLASEKKEGVVDSRAAATPGHGEDFDSVEHEEAEHETDRQPVLQDPAATGNANFFSEELKGQFFTWFTYISQKTGQVIGQLSAEALDYWLTNRAIAIRSEYSDTVVNVVSHADVEEGEVQVDEAVHPDLALDCFFACCSGNDGWAVENHAFFAGRASLKTHMVDKVLKAFIVSFKAMPLPEEGSAAFVRQKELLAFIDSPELSPLKNKNQARELFLQIFMVDVEPISRHSHVQR